MKALLTLIFMTLTTWSFAQVSTDSSEVYKKKVLESVEVDFLMSYYSQDGDNSAVGGGIGTEELTDLTPTFVVSVPLNDDDILVIDVGISAYSSASSSNIDPFDGDQDAEPFLASSGASRSDVYFNVSTTYRHSSDDRNQIWSGNLSFSAEYDYLSLGIGGSYTRLFNEKNTELSIKANAYFDTWSAIYPIELSTFLNGPRGDDEADYCFDFDDYVITGNPNYNPSRFREFDNERRNSYSLGMTFSQILSKNMQALLSIDLVRQDGLLSTPYQRVYFADKPDSFIENFHLADDNEKLPDTRFKVAVGGRLNYFVNHRLTLRSYYRYYLDDWGINGHTASITIPYKVSDKLTVYPNYRYYTQQAADYFAPYDEHLSTDTYYTSDYDLSEFNSHQYGIGVGYTDIFTKAKVFSFGLKNVDLRFNYYDRSTGLSAFIISAGVKFVMD